MSFDAKRQKNLLAQSFKLKGKNSSIGLVSCTNFSHLRKFQVFYAPVFWLGLFLVVFVSPACLFFCQFVLWSRGRTGLGF